LSQDKPFGEESQTVEFKSSVSNKKKIAIALVAFANTDGGTLYVGVNDSGQPVVTTNLVEVKGKVVDIASECKPPIRPESMEIVEWNGLSVVKVVVRKSSEIHCTPQGTFHIRISASSRLMTIEEIRVRLSEVDGKSYRIEKIEGQLVIIRNFNIVYWEPPTAPVGVLTIEDLLWEGDRTKDNAMFFRSSGPQWIDFEEGFVHIREEVNEIITRYESERILLIKGKPASGKSVVLRSVGYQLAKEGKKVFVVELNVRTPGIQNVKNFVDRVLKFCDSTLYLFIDDAHLDTAFANDVLREIKNLNILISTRDVEEQLGGQRLGELEEYSKRGIEIKAEHVGDRIISLFLRKHTKKVTPRIKEKLNEYKKNLWFLARALDTFRDEDFRSVDKNKILEKVAKWMTTGLARDYPQYENHLRNASNTFLPLSVLYRHEIPVNQTFVQLLGSTVGEINALVSINEIVRVMDKKRVMLSLHHSSLADLYFDAFEQYGFLGERIKKNVPDWRQTGLFGFYIQKLHAVACDVITGLSGWTLNFIADLVDARRDEIRQGIESEKEIWKIGGCFEVIASASEEVAGELAGQLSIENLAKKIEEEEDVGNISGCFRGIADADEEVARKLAGQLSIENLAKKIEKEEDVGKISWCVRGIAYASEEVAVKLVSVVAGKMKERDFEEIGWCVGGIAYASEQVAKNLVGELDVEIMKREIGGEKDIGKIGSFVQNIALASKEVAQQLMDSLEPGNARPEEAAEEIKRLKKEYGSK
jgi:hypothetical protein